MSKEHLFSDWLRELFPRSADDTHSVGIAEDAPYKITKHQGHSGTKKLKTVCEKCNNEWMSRLDNNAKPIASQLIQGNTTLVGVYAQRALAAWFAKTAIVADSRNSKRSVVTQAQRSAMMTLNRPPDEWEVWIAPYDGTDFRDLALLQKSGRLDFSPVAPPGIKFSGYVETTFFGMGKLIAIVVGDVPAVDFNVGTFSNLARRIWPTRRAFTWPFGRPLNDIEATSVANILDHMVSNFRQQ